MFKIIHQSIPKQTQCNFLHLGLLARGTVNLLPIHKLKDHTLSVVRYSLLSIFVVSSLSAG